MRIRVLNVTAPLVAITMALSACNSGVDADAHDEDVPTLTTTTVPLALSPSSQKGSSDTSQSINAAQPPEGMTLATVPDLDGSKVNVFTSKATDGTLPVKSTDGRTYKASEGRQLIAVGWALPSTDTTSSGYSMNIPHTISVIADGKTLATQSLDRDTYVDGGGWIMSIPKTGSPITVRLSADGGQQNVPAGSAKRDDATSNGMPVDTTINAPVAAKENCDVDLPDTSGVAGCTSIVWTLTDHDPSYGWAKPGKALLISDMPTINVPTQTSGTIFDPGPKTISGVATDPKLTNNKLDGRDALVNKRDTESGAASMKSAFEVAAADAPRRMSTDVAWTSVMNHADTRPDHAALSVTGGHAHNLSLEPHS